jgi:hypothetical protein
MKKPKRRHAPALIEANAISPRVPIARKAIGPLVIARQGRQVTGQRARMATVRSAVMRQRARSANGSHVATSPMMAVLHGLLVTDRHAPTPIARSAAMHHLARSANGSRVPVKAVMIAQSAISNRAVTSPMMVARLDPLAIDHPGHTATARSVAMRHPVKSASGNRAPAKAAMIARNAISNQEVVQDLVTSRMVQSPLARARLLPSHIQAGQAARAIVHPAASHGERAKQCAWSAANFAGEL